MGSATLGSGWGKRPSRAPLTRPRPRPRSAPYYSAHTCTAGPGCPRLDVPVPSFHCPPSESPVQPPPCPRPRPAAPPSPAVPVLTPPLFHPRATCHPRTSLSASYIRCFATVSPRALSSASYLRFSDAICSLMRARRSSARRVDPPKHTPATAR
jgi:hypothetical protein